MLYSLGGAGSIEFEGTRLEVKKGDLAIIPATKIERCINEIIEESSALDPECPQAVELNAELLSLYLRREIEASRNPRRGMIAWKLDQLWNRVDKSLNQDWTVEQLAAESPLLDSLPSMVILYL